MDEDAQFDEKIVALIAEGVPGKFKKQAISKESRLQRDLGLDSLALAALVFRLEDTFAIDLTGIDLGGKMGRMRTVGDAIETSREIIQQARGAHTAGD